MTTIVQRQIGSYHRSGKPFFVLDSILHRTTP